MFFPKLPSFFKSIRPKQFDYHPFYYDEKKERIESRRQEIGQGQTNFPHKEHGGYKEMGWGRRKEVHYLQQQSNRRLLIIIAVLSLLAYLLLR